MRTTLAVTAAGCLVVAGCSSGLAPQVASPPVSPAPSQVSPQPTASATAGAPSGAASPACAQGTGQPTGVGTQLTGIQFTSARQGWVVGRHLILATSNGGTSWHVQDQGNLDLTSVDFIDSQTGWAVGSQSLLITHDGGNRWTALPEPCPLIRSVHFVSARLGFAVAGGANIVNSAPQTGGVLLSTDNGGQSWQRTASPASAQTVCFSSATSGWLGADGHLYSSTDGGRTWVQRASGMSPPRGGPTVMSVQCAAGAVWAVNTGLGAALGHVPHWGYHGNASAAVPIFAEQYFPHPGVRITASSPGPYPGPLSAISSSTAAFVDFCAACGEGAAPWDLATNGGGTLVHEGNVGGINQPVAASFVSRSTGWVIGDVLASSKARIVHTGDGGRNWQLQYTSR